MIAIAGALLFNENTLTHNSLLPMLEVGLQTNPITEHTSSWGLGKTCLRTQNQQELTQNDRVIIVGKTRIDNKDALIKNLNIDQSLGDSISDETLLCHAYLRWGKDLVRHLKGFWLFALWDKQEKTMLVARDDSIQTRLYYYQDSNRFVFASTIKGLLATNLVPTELDHEQIYTFYGIPNDRETLYKNVYHLNSATALVISTHGDIKQIQYTPSEFPDISLQENESYSEKFSIRFTQNIDAIISPSKNTGITLSSGLDSGSIAAIAGGLLKAKNKQLFAYSYVPIKDFPRNSFKCRRILDESSGIQGIADFSGNIRTHFVSSEAYSYIEAARHMMDLIPLPCGHVNNGNWLTLLQAAQKDQIDTLLVGQHGNLSISYTGDLVRMLCQLWANNKKIRIFRELMDYKTTKNLSVPQLIKHLAKSAIPHRTKNYLINKKHMRYCFFKPEHIDIARHQTTLPSNYQKIPWIFFKNLKHMNTNMYYYNELGGYFDIDIQDPTAQRDIINFCLSLPESAFMEKGKEKLLIRDAMKNLLPHDILWNPRRGLQSADLNYRAAQQQQEIGDTLAVIKNSYLCQHYMDLTSLDTTFSNLRKNKEALPDIDMIFFFRKIFYAMFLLRFEGKFL